MGLCGNLSVYCIKETLTRFPIRREKGYFTEFTEDDDHKEPLNYHVH